MPQLFVFSEHVNYTGLKHQRYSLQMKNLLSSRNLQEVFQCFSSIEVVSRAPAVLCLQSDLPFNKPSLRQKLHILMYGSIKNLVRLAVSYIMSCLFMAEIISCLTISQYIPVQVLSKMWDAVLAKAESFHHFFGELCSSTLSHYGVYILFYSDVLPRLSKFCLKT